MRSQIPILTLIFTVSLLFAGCSEFDTPTGYEAMTRPFGNAASFSRGTSKEEVRADWGEPDQILPLGVDELGNRREEWVYKGRLNVPIDYGYVSHTQHLYFEGNSLFRSESERPDVTEKDSDKDSY